MAYNIDPAKGDCLGMNNKPAPIILKSMLRVSILMGLSLLLLSSCFMESAIPLSPVKQASYPADIVDTWAMMHKKNAIYVIEKKDKNQLKITFWGKGPNRENDQVSIGHISRIDGETYFNNKPVGKNRYEFYKFTRPCPDLILIYLPNPELIDKDIKSGRVKGRIVQDFMTSRIIEENRAGLIKYIRSYQGKLFLPFRYMVRQSKVGKLSKECKSKIKPLPGQKSK